MNRRVRIVAPALLCLAALSCQSRSAPRIATPTPTASVAHPPPPGTASARVEPPPAGVTPDAPFPPVQERQLESGFTVRVVERRVHPLIALTLVVRSGTATDLEKPGLALVAGELLKAGGAGAFGPQKLVERAESLGTSLQIVTDRDSTRISLDVTTGNLDAALEIMAAVALRPAFAAGEFEKLREREIERVKSSARGSASWAGSMVLFRELYSLPTSVHPYSRYDALPADLAKLTLADCRAWHKAHFVPPNASLIVVGDVTADQIQQSAGKWFAGWKGEPPPRPSFSQPFTDTPRNVYVVDRPGSGQSQVYVGMLGPERKAPQWPALALANQVLGGGVSGRLFLDVREKRSLAYSTGSALGEVAHGAVPLVLSAGTQTPKAAEAVRALLENLERLVAAAPTQAEVDRAKRYLIDGFLFRLETVGSVLALTAQLDVLGLPSDYYDDYRKALRGLEPPAVGATASKNYAATPVIVVAGDGATLGPALAEFGPVAVVDPEQGFTLKRSHPKKP